MFQFDSNLYIMKNSKELLNIVSNNSFYGEELEKKNNIKFSFNTDIINKQSSRLNKTYFVNSTINTISELLFRLTLGRTISYYRKNYKDIKLPDNDRVPLVHNIVIKDAENFHSTNFLILDIDAPEFSGYDINKILKEDKNFLFLYTTPSFIYGENNKIRLFYLLNRVITDNDQLKNFNLHIGKKYNIDKSCIGSHCCFFGNNNGIFILSKELRKLKCSDLDKEIKKEKKIYYNIDTNIKFYQKKLDIILNNCIVLNYMNSKQIEHNDWVIVLNNIMKLENGENILRERIKGRWGNSLVKFEETLKYFKNRYNYPTPCSCCTYHHTCLLYNLNINFKNLYIMAITKEKLKDPKCIYIKKYLIPNNKKISLKQAQQLLENKINDIYYNKPNNKFYIIRAPTGIGKSTTLINLKLPGLYVFKNHRLEDEFNIGTKYPEILENFPLFELISNYYELGIPTNKILKYIIDNNKNNQEVINYKNQLKLFHKDNIKKITHSRLLLSNKIKKINSKTIFIDEDILFSSISSNSTTQEILFKITNILYSDNKLKLYTIFKKLKKFTSNFVNIMKNNINETLKEEILENVKNNIVKLKKNRISNNEIKSYIQFITCEYFLFNNKTGRIEFINSEINKLKELLKDRKVVLLSATPVCDFYKYIFGEENVEFIDFENIEFKGNIITYLSSNLPLYKEVINKDLNNNITRIIKSIENIKQLENIETKEIITYKYLKDTLNKHGYNLSEYFHNTEGTNKHSGKDMFIYGVPQLPMNFYRLITRLLGKNSDSDEELVFKKVYDGDSFIINMYSSKNDNVAYVHLILIQNELIQAAGRARTISNNCNVFVISNIPISNSIIKMI